MADTIAAGCPSCGKTFQVPQHLAGKTLRCKACQATFAVPPAPGAAPTPGAKPKSAGADAPLRFKEDPPAAPKPAPPAPLKTTRSAATTADEDENSDPYAATHDDLDVPRCPFCAEVLDPPDTKVCLNCGYDLLDRKRHASKRVYEHTNGDYFKHWLPGIIWLAVAGGALGLSIACGLNMRAWLTGSFLDKEEKNAITDQAEFYAPPYCFNIWIWTFCAFIILKGVSFAYKRLVLNWRPVEIVKK